MISAGSPIGFARIFAAALLYALVLLAQVC